MNLFLPTSPLKITLTYKFDDNLTLSYKQHYISSKINSPRSKGPEQKGSNLKSPKLKGPKSDVLK